MTVERLAVAVGEAADRNGFLARISAVTLGFLGYAGLVPETAQAWTGHGCTLCNAPGTCGPEASCFWCWPGSCHGSPSHWHYCCEGYRGTDGCRNGNCPAWCSYLNGTFSC